MNPYLQIYIECLKVWEGANPQSPDERRAQFVVITGGKVA
jgi:hypothetical protein